MDDHLRAGVAIYNSGEFHAAHDAWEAPWLDLDRGTDDERLLHGLIQFTAAIHHATVGNRAGAVGLARSAREYLAGLAGHRGVNVTDAREYLERLATDPTLPEEHEPPELTLEEVALALADLEFEAGAIAALVLAEEYGYEEDVIERAVAYGRRDLEAGRETSPFVTLVLDFARDADHRGIVANRLRDHVDRREAREADLEGLFEERGDGAGGS